MVLSNGTNGVDHNLQGHMEMMAVSFFV